MTVKEQVHKIIDTLPDDMNMNDIAYSLYVISKIEQGNNEIEEGKGIPHEDAVKIMKSWQK